MAVSMFKDILERTKFTKISRLHVVVAIPLLITIYAVSRISYYIVQQEGISSGITSIESLDTITLGLLGFYALYVIGSSFSIYKLYDNLIDHILYSSILVYNWCKELDCDYQGVIRTGLERRKIPSPVTTVIVNVLTAGAAYPVLLGLFEKYISMHWFSEEKALFKKTRVKVKSTASILFDIALLFLTLGVYMVYWIFRSIQRYNKHIEAIHSKHPHPPTIPTQEFPSETKSLALVLGILLFFTGLYSLAILIIPWIFPVMILGFGFMLPYIAYLSRGRSLLKQSLTVLFFEYVYMLTLAVIGLAAYPYYSSTILKGFEEQTREIISSNNFMEVATMIFLNNVKISAVALVPIIGMAYAGYALSLTGFVYGLIIGTLMEKSVSQAIGALSILVAPHAPLELYSYALSLSIATRIGREPSGSLALKAILSITILLAAAFIEAILIVGFPFIPESSPPGF
ncbi:hypothetical protein J4526_00170 [Desulfurococcaceae archaeon MEX13E-LK6-19]|nr:hypothetical protein J4526_00170 [Desulfurococcaceae archaeon MEX13E-LK6-19]